MSELKKDFGTTTAAASVERATGDPRSELAAPSVKEVLIAARKLIEKPENWCQHALSRDAGGLGSAPGVLFPDAVAFCMSGAIMKAGHGKDFYRLAEFVGEVIGTTLPQFNDTHTHAEVLAAFDRAIERPS